MGMYATHNTAEESLCIDTEWLKKHDYFCGYRSGGITWTWGWGDNKSSINFIVDTMNDFPNIRFRYSTKQWGDDESKQMDYSFSLVKVPCNLGSFRWAFKCGLWKNGHYCGRKVYKLYSANSEYFGCRKCMNIVYESQRKSGSRFESLDKLFRAEKKAEKLEQTITKTHYQGVPTRKIRKLMKLRNNLSLHEHPMITLERMLR
jgi:hypothetical protein